MAQECNKPLLIRAHHILCMQGFQGYGYSSEFVANMRQVVDKVKAHPERAIEIIARCDAICSECPHQHNGFCLKRPDSDGKNRELDRRVLQRLGLEEGMRLQAGEALALVNASICTVQDADDFCGHCGWRDRCLWFLSRSR